MASEKWGEFTLEKWLGLYKLFGVAESRYSRLQLSEVQIIVRAQHCCAPTCVPLFP
ncbi:MAG: hypothetical protein V7K18_25850 [Nostoc sp.]|uniref:hypothetical protein n=1 Tax=Nostoc sp. TaxID=1180 RepID=UPI002FF8CB19